MSEPNLTEPNPPDTGPVTGPIADLSYRTYDGPLSPPRARWWAIARAASRQTFAKRGFWILTVLGAWYYLVMIVIVFFVEQVLSASPQPTNRAMDFFTRIVWKDQFLHGLSFAQLIFMIVTLMAGAGAIANDNRANALLVYLSKPCTKGDYIIGKWIGVFMPVFVAMALPTFVFYLYGAMTFQSYGFLTADPWMGPKLLALLPLMAAFQTSLILGFSSCFNQGRLAGFAYAGLYMLTNLFTQLMVGVFMNYVSRDNTAIDQVPATVKTFFYASIDGLNIGLTKAILGTHGSPYFGIPSRIPSMRAPELLPVLALIIALSVGATVLAWRRVRAVEVVG